MNHSHYHALAYTMGPAACVPYTSQALLVHGTQPTNCTDAVSPTSASLQDFRNFLLHLDEDQCLLYGEGRSGWTDSLIPTGLCPALAPAFSTLQLSHVGFPRQPRALALPPSQDLTVLQL